MAVGVYHEVTYQFWTQNFLLIFFRTACKVLASQYQRSKIQSWNFVFKLKFYYTNRTLYTGNTKMASEIELVPKQKFFIAFSIGSCIQINSLVCMVQEQLNNIFVPFVASKHQCSPSIIIFCIQPNFVRIFENFFDNIFMSIRASPHKCSPPLIISFQRFQKFWPLSTRGRKLKVGIF